MAETAIYFLMFALGCTLAYIVHSTKFCIMGAITDYLYVQSTERLSIVLASICLALIGVQVLRICEAFPASFFTQDVSIFQHALHPIRQLVGATLMGVGMVLASGCPTQQLVQAGLLQIKHLFLLLLLAVSAHAAQAPLMQAFFKLFEVQILAMRPPLLSPGAYLVIACLGLLALLFMQKSQPQPQPQFQQQQSHKNVRRHLSIIVKHHLPAIYMACVIVAFWWISAVFSYVAQDPQTLDYAYLGNPNRTLYALSMLLPLTELLHAILFNHTQISLYAFMLLGMLAFGVMWRIFKPISAPQTGTKLSILDLQQGAIGVILMGIGGVMAFGCTFGQGLGAASLGHVSSLIAFAGFFLGAKIAGHLV